MRKTSASTFVFIHLHPHTLYQFRVNATYNHQNCAKKPLALGPAVRVRTQAFVPNPPNTINVMALGSNSLQIGWDSVQYRYGTVGYLVYYNITRHRYESKSAKSTNVLLTGLTPSTKYEVKVAVVVRPWGANNGSEDVTSTTNRTKLIVTLHASPPSPPKCPNGSVYNTCGTACPLTCDSPHPRTCTRQCVLGCFCPTGMLQRNTTCVTPDECNKCHYNGRTYRNGERFNSTDGCNRCICLEGHVACTRKACPVLHPLLCPNGKEYRECGTACPPTCQKGPLRCTLQCVRGCFCPHGLVEHNGQCIKPSKCLRQETPCDQLRSNQTTTCNGLIGCFVTSCEPDGSFSSQQCHPSTGYCWCVDDSGNKLEGTDTAPYLVSMLDCTKPVVAVPTPANATPTPSPPICPMNKTFGCGSACPLTCSYPSVRVCTRECVFDCNCPRGLLDAGDVCVTGNSCSGLSSGCELVKGKKEFIYFNGCRSVRRVFVPKCMGWCTEEGSRARCRATDGLKQQMVAFRCKPKEKGGKKYTTTMTIAVAERCSCSLV
ncbi:von Willebrand factor-like isoform X2 [Corticium candelabrum]|nr:von Willebrand factor-like isoform X2 [Corticium candelabrum]